MTKERTFDYVWGVVTGILITFVGTILADKYSETILNNWDLVEYAILIVVTIFIQLILSIIRLKILRGIQSLRSKALSKKIKTMNADEREELRKKFLE